MAAQQSPFSKVMEKMVDKFKIVTPGGETGKRNCGSGRVSIQRGEFGEEEKKIVLYQLIFRNGIGKQLFGGTIHAV